MPTTVFDPSEGPSAEQQAAETAALEQGEKIAKLQDEDRARKYAETEAANEEAGLIAGKFKSQDDLVKAYEELQRKLGQDTPEEAEESSEETTETPEEEPESEEEVSEASAAVTRASEAYLSNGELTEESIEELSKLDSKDLIKAYMTQYAANQEAAKTQAVTADAERAILDSVGGQESYQQMVQWAAGNLDPAEVESYNQVTNSGNVAAIKFAVEALSNRYKAAEGYEAPLVTGKKAPSSDAKSFRSHAELSRAIADPRYRNDPAYRSDVEARLARSTDLL
jgi:hypothetical protein